MKIRHVFTKIAIACAALVLAACGETVPSDSVDTATASDTSTTVSETDTSTTADSSSDISSNTSSDTETGSSSDISTSEPTGPVAAWKTDLDDLYVAGAAGTLEVEITGLEGTETVTYAWSQNLTSAQVIVLGSSTTDSITVSPVKAGVATVSCVVAIDDEVQTLQQDVVVRVDRTSGSEIDEAADLIALISQTSTTITGNYYLSANIDLASYDFNGCDNNNTFNGSLDGYGHSISGLVIKGASANNMNGGLFRTFNGSFFDVSISAVMPAIGWSGVLGGNVNQPAVVSNCYITCECTGDISSAWQFNGVIGGVVTGAAITNCVIDTTGTYSANWFALAAYMNGYPEVGSVPQMSYVTNNYTSAPYAADPHGAGRNYNRCTPFSPASSGQSWVQTFDDIQGDILLGGLVWASTPASTYTLSEDFWDLADNAVPSLVTAS